MTNTIADHVRKNFAGMLVFGDIHSDFISFMKARAYAEENNLFFHSLGDLVDRGTQPFEVVKAMAGYVRDATGGFTIGNHDDKFHRHAKGNKVNFSKDGKATFQHVGEERLKEFLELYTELHETPILTGLVHKFDDFTLVHAASHPSIWDGPKEGSTGKSARSRFLVGETTGKMGDDGYPERLYSWIDEVPMGKTVIVGHDRMPVFDRVINEPLHCANANGGKVIFMDTGCGKGGFLTAAIMRYDRHFKIEKYVEFR